MRITNLKDIRAAVWAGIGFLDANVPGWRKKINLRRLDLASPKLCVLGEVYGDYSDGADRLGFEAGSDLAAQLGFVVPKIPGTNARDMTLYPRLTAEWRAAYRAGQRQARRAKAARA